MTPRIIGSYVNRHPPKQLPHDPAKKNLVILGNGWASTSLLKSLDTEGYNVVSRLFVPLLFCSKAENDSF